MKISSLLHLATTELETWQRTPGGWHPGPRFGSDEQALFGTWLSARRQRHVLLVDLPGERWLCDPLPAVSRRDQGRLMELRLARQFPEGAPAFWQAVKGQPGKAILAGLDENAALAPWLNTLSEHRLAAIMTPALLAGTQLPPQQTGKTPAVLATRSGECLRLTAVLAGQTLYTSLRLSVAARDFASILGSEASRLRQTLLAADWLHADTVLPIYCQQFVPEPAPLPEDTPSLCFTALATTQTDALSATLDALEQHRPRVQFASRRQRQCDRHSRWRHIAWTLALSSWLLALPLAAWQYHALEQLQAESEQWSQRQQQLLSELAGEDEAAARSASALARAQDSLSARQKLPDSLFAALASSLDQHEGIALEELTWHNDGQSPYLDVTGTLAAPSADLAKFVANLRVDRGILPSIVRAPDLSGSTAASAGSPPGFLLRLHELPP